MHQLSPEGVIATRTIGRWPPSRRWESTSSLADLDGPGEDVRADLIGVDGMVAVAESLRERGYVRHCGTADAFWPRVAVLEHDGKVLGLALTNDGLVELRREARPLVRRLRKLATSTLVLSTRSCGTKPPGTVARVRVRRHARGSEHEHPAPLSGGWTAIPPDGVEHTLAAARAAGTLGPCRCS